MTIKANYPSSRPRVYNFVNSDQIDGRLNFSRDSEAYYLAPSGWIEESPLNTPRFENVYDATTNTVITSGLLVENDTINYLPWSLKVCNVSDPAFPVDNRLGLPNSLEYNSAFVTAPDGFTQVPGILRKNTTQANYFTPISGRNAKMQAIDPAATSILMETGDVFTQSIFVKPGDAPDGTAAKFDLYSEGAAIDSGGSQLSNLGVLWSVIWEQSGSNFVPVEIRNSSNCTVISNTQEEYPNGWWRLSVTGEYTIPFTGAAGIKINNIFFGVNEARDNSNNYIVDTTSYVWGQQFEPGGLSTPSQWEYSGTVINIPSTTISTPTRDRDELILNASGITSNTTTQQPSLYIDAVNKTTNNGFTLFVGKNAGNTSNIASFQKDNYVQFQVGNVNNSGDDYPDYPKTLVIDGRNKFLFSFGDVNIPAEQMAYVSTNSIRLEDATLPVLDQISFGNDAITTGLDIPNSSALFKAIYIWEGTLPSNQAQSLIGESTANTGEAPERNDNLLQFKIITDPDFTGNLQFDLLKPNPADPFILNGYGLSFSETLAIDYGNGFKQNNNPVNTPILYRYASNGLYNVQITGAVNGINTDAAVNDGIYSFGPQILEVYSFGTALGGLIDWTSTLPKPFCFNGWNNCTSYPANLGDVTGLNVVDTRTWTAFNYMHSDNTVVTQIPRYNVDSATTLEYMFNNCRALSKIEINTGNSQIDNVIQLPTAQAWNGRYMFNGCQSLDSDNYGGPGSTFPTLDLTQCTDSSYMFGNCGSIKKLQSIMVGASLTNTGYMFSGCNALTNIPSFSNYPNANCSGSAIAGMFQNVSSISNDDDWANVFNPTNPTDWQKITTLNRTWANANNPDLPGKDPADGGWDMSKVTNFRSTFLQNANGVSRLTKFPDWDYSASTNFFFTFSRCDSIEFDSDIPIINSINCQNFKSAFFNCRLIVEPPITTTSGCTTKAGAGTTDSGCNSIFYNCLNFKPTLNGDQRIPFLLGLKTNEWGQAFFRAGFNRPIGDQQNTVTAILLTINEERQKLLNTEFAANAIEGVLGLEQLPKPRSSTDPVAAGDYVNNAAAQALQELEDAEWTVTF